jgi:hypothetical protein
MMIGTVQARRLWVLIAAAAAIALPSHPDSARSAELPAQDSTTAGSSSNSKPGIDTVTIDAQRERQLKLQISNFVSGLVVKYMNDSLERWDSPICPLVAGLTSEQGEFILARVSQIARDSHAPLAGEHCKPNFFVVLSDNPDLLVEKWSQRDKGLLNTCNVIINGMGYAKDFLHSRQPVRVYYNGRFRASGGANRDISALDLMGLSLDFHFSRCTSGGAELGTRLRYSDVQELTSVIIVVDSRRTTDLNMGQLADYVAMVGLAQIRPNADMGTLPTILSVFGNADPRPQGLSSWDQSFLRSLYTTNQSSVLQVGMIKTGMFEQIAGR